MGDTMDDTEEGEILEDGEIADEDEAIDSSGDQKTEEKENNNNREKDSYNRDRDCRRRDSEKDIRKSEDRIRDNKDKSDRRSDRGSDRDRDRRDRYERNDRSDRDRRSDSNDRERREGSERDRKISATNSEDERRRKERERKRRRSDEEDRDDRQKETDKRKRGRDQNWSEYNNNNSNNNNNNNNMNNESNSNKNISNNRNNNFDDFERRPFDDFDFRIPEAHGFPNTGPMHERDLNDEEDLNFDERDFEEMLQIMEHRMPSNRVGAMDAMEKKEMMRAMALMISSKRNLDSDKFRRLARLRERRRTNERQPGPTGTRAVGNLRAQERPTPFKQMCKYFMDGKCHKGADCPFSHDGVPLKKKELCKFYLQGFCGKGEDCLFMHSEFPCKFFHTNVECYSGDNCRFSHSPLTEETREILRNYLDSGTLPDDPKPERQHQHRDRHSDTEHMKNAYKESHNQSHNSQTNSENNTNLNSSPVPPVTGFQPIKPVSKRHAILGDPTPEMKNCHLTWIWQQEMKELEVAYVGNKRNLFCIEKPFVMSEKPPTPRMEDDEEEIEAQIRNYYKDTLLLPDLCDTENTATKDIDHRQEVTKPALNCEEQKLIEASAHDEDLRTILMRPRSHTNESINSQINNDIDERSGQPMISNEELQLKGQSVGEVPQNLPKVARDLYLKMQTKNKLQNESEVKSNDWQSDSDDDDKNVLAAALKNVQQSSRQSPTDKISQMLSIIRNTSNTSAANQSPKQSEFWQNLMSGIHMTGATSGSPSGNSTPPRNDFRDPRLKRGKESMSPSVEAMPAVKICDPNVKIEYKLVPIRAHEIDYSTYVSIYRIDARLKNDPRLQKFFSRLPSSEIDNLSRIVPPPLKTAPVTPLSVLKSKKNKEKDNQKDTKRERTPKADSPTLPPLPPLTISPSKLAPTPGIFPPTPPPIMSPLELISSRPTYTVSADTKSPKLDTSPELVVITSKTDGIQPIDSIYGNKLEIKAEILSPPPPPPLLLSTKSRNLTSSSEDTELEPIIKVEKSAIESQSLPIVKTAANYVCSDRTDIKPVLNSLSLTPSTTLTTSPSSSSSSSSQSMTSPLLTSNCLTTELFESSFDTSIDSEIKDQIENNDQKLDEQMETASNYSTEDDIYENLYPCPTSGEYLSSNTVTSDQLKPISSSSSPRSSIDEFELIRNELKGPTLVSGVDSDNEMEIDLRQRQDSVSEVESADECELMIASASETEDNNDSDIIYSSANNYINVAKDSQNNDLNSKPNAVPNESNNYNNNNEINTKNTVLSDEQPMNLSVNDVQNSGVSDETENSDQNSDQSLKSVFSTIDPTASPFC